MCGLQMEPLVVMAERKSTMKVSGKKFAMTGAKKQLRWCAERPAAVILSLRPKHPILEKHVTSPQSKPSALEMRPLSHSAQF